MRERKLLVLRVADRARNQNSVLKILRLLKLVGSGAILSTGLLLPWFPLDWRSEFSTWYQISSFFYGLASASFPPRTNHLQALGSA